jgi:hypothetical protein
MDRLQPEPESICKRGEEQMERLETVETNSRKQEAERKEKALKDQARMSSFKKQKQTTVQQQKPL